MRCVFGDCTLDTERYELRRAGQVIALEPRAFRVLAYLLQHAGLAVAKQALVHACWPGPSSEAISQEYALRNCLMKIRQAVGDAGTPQAVIETVRGYGYRVTATVTVLPPEARAAGTVSPDHANVPTPPVPSAPSQILPGRRQLTVLRCALVGEFAWARRDPEDVRTVLQALYTTCEEVIQHFDGYIAQYDSVGLLVYFGYPTADEAAAPRAVRAGLRLVDTLGCLTVRVAADTPIRLAVRVSIHTGIVVVGTVGAGGWQDSVVLGDTPQVAARLQGLAAPGTVVVSAATWRLVQGYFTGHALGPQPLPGADSSVQAYRVLGPSGAQHRLDVVSPRGLTPLVGREAELALLRARWAQARDGLGQVVLLSGEAWHWQIPPGAGVAGDHRGRAACPRGVALYTRCPAESAPAGDCASAPAAALALGDRPGDHTAHPGSDAGGVWLDTARGGTAVCGAALAAAARALPPAGPHAAAAATPDPGGLTGLVAR